MFRHMRKKYFARSKCILDHISNFINAIAIVVSRSIIKRNIGSFHTTRIIYSSKMFTASIQIFPRVTALYILYFQSQSMLQKANLKNHFRHESYCNEFRNQQTKRKSLTDVPLVHEYSVPRDVYHAESVASMGSKNESAFHSRRSQRGRESRRWFRQKPAS